MPPLHWSNENSTLSLVRCFDLSFIERTKEPESIGGPLDVVDGAHQDSCLDTTSSIFLNAVNSEIRVLKKAKIGKVLVEDVEFEEHFNVFRTDAMIYSFKRQPRPGRYFSLAQLRSPTMQQLIRGKSSRRDGVRKHKSHRPSLEDSNKKPTLIEKKSDKIVLDKMEVKDHSRDEFNEHKPHPLPFTSLGAANEKLTLLDEKKFGKVVVDKVEFDDHFNIFRTDPSIYDYKRTPRASRKYILPESPPKPTHKRIVSKKRKALDFPLEENVMKKSRMETQLVPICYCRRGKKEGAVTLQCHSCSMEFHAECMKISQVRYEVRSLRI